MRKTPVKYKVIEQSAIQQWLSYLRVPDFFPDTTYLIEAIAPFSSRFVLSYCNSFQFTTLV